MQRFNHNLLILFLYPLIIFYSCSNNSITGDHSSSLGRTGDRSDFFDDNNSPDTDPVEPLFEGSAGAYILMLASEYFTQAEWSEKDKQRFPVLICLIDAINSITSSGSDPNCAIEEGYDFRDNYLSKSEKGRVYTACYYLLSKYGIENNLIMKYSMEHLSLINKGVEVSQAMQHGNDNDQILINRSIYNEIKELSAIYRISKNHKDIDPVLDYLEKDLEKYLNKTRSEIVRDFQ